MRAAADIAPEVHLQVVVMQMEGLCERAPTCAKKCPENCRACPSVRYAGESWATGTKKPRVSRSERGRFTATNTVAISATLNLIRPKATARSVGWYEKNNRELTFPGEEWKGEVEGEKGGA